MVFVTQTVLLFSFNKQLITSLSRYIINTGKRFKENSLFKLYMDSKGLPPTFSHIQEITYIIDECDLATLANFIIIVDLYSFDNDDKEAKKILNEIIIQYPEIKIVFISFEDDWNSFFYKKLPIKCSKKQQEKCSKKLNNTGWKPFNLLCKKNEDTNKECTPKKCTPIACDIQFRYIHSFNPLTEGSFNRLICGQSNVFDASNLRNVIRQELNQIGTQTNYPLLQCSRIKHLAFSIDEEMPQSYLTAYSLYIMGYRVLPITSCTELSYLIPRKNKDGTDEKEKIGNSGINLIIRDWDLQFEDYNSLVLPKKNTDESNNIQSRNDNLNPLRGFFYNNKKKVWEKDTNSIWRHFIDKYPELEIWFLTKLSDSKTKNIHFTRSGKHCTNRFLNKFLKTSPELGLGYEVIDNTVYLQAISKPLCGLFQMMDIPSVRKTYHESIDNESIETQREGGNHSIPPSCFHMADNMLRRAHKYYDCKMYMLSALLSREAYEILNGFHFVMILNTIHQQAIAEANLETLSLGLNETILSRSMLQRSASIRQHIERICADNDNARHDVLSQVYNDSRHIYKEKEQYKAADSALMELIIVQYGFSITKKIKELYCKLLGKV